MRAVLLIAVRVAGGRAAVEQEQKGPGMTGQGLTGRGLTGRGLTGRSLTDQDSIGQDLTGPAQTDRALTGPDSTSPLPIGLSLTVAAPAPVHAVRNDRDEPKVAWRDLSPPAQANLGPEVRGPAASRRAAGAEPMAPVAQPHAATLVQVRAGVRDRPRANGLAGNRSRVLAGTSLQPADDRSPSFARSRVAAFPSRAEQIVSREARAVSVVQAEPDREGQGRAAGSNRAVQNPLANDPAKDRDTEVADRFIASPANEFGVSQGRAAC
jgi:hypothetical protein